MVGVGWQKRRGAERGWFGWVVTLLVVAVFVVPMVWSPRRDSFPVSSYPMFSERRPSDRVVLVVAGVDNGHKFEVLPKEATAHRQLTQAVRALATAAREGGERPVRLCREVARWVAGQPVVRTGRVGIVTVTYDGVGFLVEDRRDPVIVDEHAWCELTP